jgi:hypothetical protein
VSIFQKNSSLSYILKQNGIIELFSKRDKRWSILIEEKFLIREIEKRASRYFSPYGY